VHPDVEAMLMTPICPHGLLHRPIVVPNQFKIKVSLAPFERPVVLTVDGQVYHDIEPGYQVVISRNIKDNVYFVANEDKTYFHTLKEKFVHNLRS
jgi:NAD+ kinase